MKHPKHRRIPRAFLKTKAFKNSNLEDKVILGVHVFEFAVIMFITVVAAATAVFLPNILHSDSNNTSDKQVESVQEDEAVTPTDEATVGDVGDRKGTALQGGMDDER